MVSQANTDAARASDPEEIYRIIREDLKPHFAALARHNSTVDVLSDPLYQSIEAKVKRVLESVELVNLSAVEAKEKPKYSFLVWNLERGIQYERQLQAFRTHKDLKGCDVLILIETDVGMARSGNRPIAQLLGRELQMNCAFVPCYLNLAKGSIVPQHSQDNEQFTYVLKGALKFWLGENGEDVRVVNEGQVLHIPPNLPHKAEALVDTLDLDVFTPIRQDWLDGTDDYFHKKG